MKRQKDETKKSHFSLSSPPFLSSVPSDQLSFLFLEKDIFFLSIECKQAKALSLYPWVLGILPQLILILEVTVVASRRQDSQGCHD